MGRKNTIITAALAAFLAASTGMAQASAPSTAPSKAKTTQAQELKAALSKLDLTPMEKLKIKQILSTAKTTLQTLKASGTADPKTAREAFEKVVQQIINVLTPEQKAKLKQILKADRAKALRK